MALKKIQYDVRLLSTEKMLQANMPIVYTNDLNSAEFVFNILDMTPDNKKKQNGREPKRPGNNSLTMRKRHEQTYSHNQKPTEQRRLVKPKH